MSQYRHPQKTQFATAGSGATVILHDDVDASGMPKAQFGGPGMCWITVALKLDQDVTLVHKWAPLANSPNSALVTINGITQTGEVAATASGFFQRSLRFQPGRNQISVVMGGTAPTANFIGVEYNDYPGIIQ